MGPYSFITKAIRLTKKNEEIRRKKLRPMHRQVENLLLYGAVIPLSEGKIRP
jgi:hypothetical protein